MPSDALLAVLAAAFLHAAWNAIAKGSGGGDALMRSSLIAIGAAVTALPGLALTGWPILASWPYVCASALIHVGYFTLIGLAYRYADYSAIYPLVRGSAPLATALLAAVCLGENLRPLAWTGVMLLCCGVVGLGSEAIRRGGLNGRSLIIAALTAVVIVAYTLTDGLGARASGDPVAYVLAMTGLTGVLALPVALGGQRALRAVPASSWGTCLAGGAMATLSYGTALWAMTKGPIGLVGALRETSVLFAALIASFILRERFSLVRWIASGAIVIGLGLIQAG